MARCVPKALARRDSAFDRHEARSQPSQGPYGKALSPSRIRDQGCQKAATTSRMLTKLGVTNAISAITVQRYRSLQAHTHSCHIEFCGQIAMVRALLLSLSDSCFPLLLGE